MLLPGWSMHSGIWGGLVETLADEYRVHLLDLPGHGFNRDVSLPCSLDEIVTQVVAAVPPAAWLGWSFGGLVSMAAALKYPQNVAKMILVGATPSFARRDGWDWGVPSGARQAFMQGLETDFETAMGQFALQTFGTDYLQEATHRLGGPPLKDKLPAGDTLRNGLQLLYDSNLLADLGGIKTSTLFLTGSHDRTIRAESSQQAAARMPDARVEIIDGAGHVPFISHEQAFVSAVRDFLAGGRTV